jgi:O-antigen/teichoic acid export membrane protein
MATAEITTPPTAPIAAPPLRVTFAWTLVGNIIYAGCQWGMISVLAKLGSTTGVGQFALALAITAPVLMLTNMWLRAVQATDAKSEFEFADYFTLRATSTATALMLVLAVIAVAGYGRTTGVIVMLVACAKAVESFTDIVAGLLQKHERLDLVAISFMLKGSFSLISFSAIYFLFRSVAAAAAGLCTTWLLVFLCYDLQLARRLLGPGARFFHWNRSHLQQLAKVAAPLGIVTTLSTLNFNVPRYALQHFRGISELGIFSALGYVVVVITLLVNALGQSAVVRLSTYFAKGKAHDFSRLLMRMSVLCVAAAGIGLALCQLIGHSVIRLVYGREYAAHIGLLKLFIVASGISAIAAVLSFGMTAARRFCAQLPVLLATISTCATAVWFLTPRWGMTGAAIALCLSAVVQASGGFLVIRHALRFKRRELNVVVGCREGLFALRRQAKEVEAEMAAGAAME